MSEPPRNVSRSSHLPLLLCALVAAVLSGSAAAHTDGQPVRPLPRRGGCPNDYSSWDSHCITNPSARGALLKIGAYCPRDFETSGEDCVAFPQAKEAIPRIGYSCPPDWETSGAYCLSP